MKNKQDKEINQFLKTFENSKSEPSDAFRKRLENCMVKEYRGSPKYYLYFKVLVPVFLIAFFFGISMNGLNFGTKNNTQQYSVSEQRKKEIFTKLATSNVLTKIEQSIATNNIAAMSDISFAESEQKELIKDSSVTLLSYPMSFPDEPILGVSERVTKGVNFEACESLTARYAGVSEIRSYYYQDESEEIVKVEEKVTTNESVLGESYPYSFPASYPLSYAIDNGLDILSEQIENGNNYFILKVEQEVQGCSENIIFTIKIEESSLEFKEIKAYSEDISDTNLIYKSEFEEITL